ncbi:Uncharacterised protein [Bartonella vinsonii]|uniref:Uncharacterized protein n=1 Tax=Bartonella vinsonii TaxID=33047 RepID=A0A3S5F8T4_BARVI|nr:Uncharacterised protein [Bartonella vinsonii]
MGILQIILIIVGVIILLLLLPLIIRGISAFLEESSDTIGLICVIALIGLGFHYLGWTLTTLILTILIAIHAIYVLQSCDRTWKETFAFCATVSLPPFISSQIVSIHYFEQKSPLIENILITVFPITFIYFIVSFILINTFDNQKKDLKGTISGIIEFYCAIAILLPLFIWSRWGAIAAIILGILWCVSYIYRTPKSIPDKKENSNENASEAH